jgi:hypothetical protein
VRKCTQTLRVCLSTLDIPSLQIPSASSWVRHRLGDRAVYVTILLVYLRLSLLNEVTRNNLISHLVLWLQWVC